MQGLIRRKLAHAAAQRATVGAHDAQPICPLCDRPIPSAQRDAHHLVPRSRGGRQTTFLHRICHRQVHALFTEAELARDYRTADALRAHPELIKFVAWVQRKPNDFFERTRPSTRKRGL